jgi:hypothetical protein
MLRESEIDDDPLNSTRNSMCADPVATVALAASTIVEDATGGADEQPAESAATIKATTCTRPMAFKFVPPWTRAQVNGFRG